jgi:hypothetical protein
LHSFSSSSALSRCSIRGQLENGKLKKTKTKQKKKNKKKKKKKKKKRLKFEKKKRFFFFFFFFHFFFFRLLQAFDYLPCMDTLEAQIAALRSSRETLVAQIRTTHSEGQAQFVTQPAGGGASDSDGGYTVRIFFLFLFIFFGLNAFFFKMDYYLWWEPLY